MLYFAYGSNIDRQQMESRCPSARCEGRARLKDYRPAFTRFGRGHNCGVADIIEEPGQSVWGVLYHIPESEAHTLDQCEGYSAGRPRAENAYERISMLVEHVDETGLTIASPEAQVYVVVNKNLSGLRPSRDYLRRIVDGARDWHLPDDYVHQLEQIQTSDS